MTNRRYNGLLELYVFGDRYDVPSLRTNVMKAWHRQQHQKYQCVLHFGVLRDVYALLPKTAVLLKSVAHDLALL